MHRRRFTVLAACLLAASLTLWAQGQGGGGGTQGGSQGTSGGSSQGGGTRGQTQSQGNYGNTNTNNNNNDPFGQQRSDPFGQMPRPLYLQGRVVTADGLPPSEPVVIQRVCNGNVIPEGWTDSKGRFSFDVGGDLSMLTTDASVSGLRGSQQGLMTGTGFGGDCVRQIGLGRFDLSSSTLRAELTGYRSEEVNLGMYSSMGKNDVGLIVLHRLDGLVGDVVSALTLQAPKGARKAYETGLREMRKKKPNPKKVISLFEKAVKEYPQFAAAWSALGDAKLKLNDREGARQAFSEAVKHDPKFIKPYEPLIQIAVDSGDWDEMESLGSAYLELNPNSSFVQYVTAVAAVNTGKTEKAEEMVLAMRAGKESDRYPQSYQIMGLVHEQRAEFEKAAGQYRTYVRVAGASNVQGIEQVKRKLHEWEMLGVIKRAAADEAPE